MRLKNVRNSDEILFGNPDIVVTNGKEHRGKWASLFQKKQPIHIEVGMGKGRFVYEMAKANPDINFIGIEKMDNVIIKAVNKQKEDRVPNLMLLRFDAKDLIEVFEDDEIDRVYLNFSDPWPKARHEKRRLTYKTFLRSYERICKTKELCFKTDNRLLFEYSVMSLNNYGCDIEFITFDLHKLDMFNIMTEYEEKWSKRGYPIYKIDAILKGRKNNG